MAKNHSIFKVYPMAQRSMNGSQSVPNDRVPLHEAQTPRLWNPYDVFKFE